ncbi:hypothetical protein [Saccharopolyspora aridisoli]|uniref:hypothetical protein n=1 Tax=Saccharopolyspora aridisoli TaxID=2530385 RepID=UPI0014045D5C|nr:hypothetical protein [Saccharopolyspora aridisoli]
MSAAFFSFDLNGLTLVFIALARANLEGATASPTNTTCSGDVWEGERPDLAA